MASVLFSPITMRGLTLPNRIAVSPMCQYSSNNGSANDWHLMHLGNMSLGCAGLVMTEMTDVNHAAGSGRQADLGRSGRLDPGGTLGDSLRHRMAGAEGHDQGRHQALHRRVRGGREARR